MLHSVDADPSYLQVLPGFVVIPLGIGLAVPCMTTALLTTGPASRSGVASGVLNSVRQSGGALGVAAYGALLNERAIAGAQLSFSISAALLILAARVAAIGVRRMPVPEKTTSALGQGRTEKYSRPVFEKRRLGEGGWVALQSASRHFWRRSDIGTTKFRFRNHG